MCWRYARLACHLWWRPLAYRATGDWATVWSSVSVSGDTRSSQSPGGQGEPPNIAPPRRSFSDKPMKLT
jgi:hypothetical protein